MDEIRTSIDTVPSWLSKILISDRHWPLYKSNLNDDLKCTAIDYLPEYFIPDLNNEKT